MFLLRYCSFGRLPSKISLFTMTLLTCNILPSFITVLTKHAFRRAISIPRKTVRHFSGGAKLFQFQNTERANASLLHGEVDRFGGVTVREFPANIGEAAFSSILRDALFQWRSEGRIAAWLHVPLSLSRLAAAAAAHGFTFHHAHGEVAVLSLWMGPGENRLPGFATHQVGVAGAVVNESNGKVLVVQDKNKTKDAWKFPGGLSNMGENIGATAIREVFEETGVQSEFRSLLSIRQQHNHPGAFGMSDMYLICRLSPLTYDISVCPHECLRCEWLSVAQLASMAEATPITKRVAALLLHGLETGFDSVDLAMEEMPAVHTGLTYQLYHRKLSQRP